MIQKQINNDQFKEAIREAFNADQGIYEMYCPCIIVQSTNDIVDDISNRIFNDEPDATIIGVFDGCNLIGYYVFKENTLISFALNVKYRTRRHLRDFFNIIKKALNENFICYLWSRNVRGIKWLMKNGMQIIQSEPLITKLKY